VTTTDLPDLHRGVRSMTTAGLGEADRPAHAQRRAAAGQPTVGDQPF
jgi:hypothetical protein